MSRIDYDGRRFRLLSSSTSGEVDDATIFEYHQIGSTVWGTYTGGSIELGMLLAKVDDRGVLDLRYQHLNLQGELMTGVCTTTPELLADGRLRLHEVWNWTSGDRSAGVSMVEEIEPEENP